MDWMMLMTVTFSLFILMDPLGNVPIFIAVLRRVPARRQRKIILRELLIALGIIIAFNLIGDFILTLLGVSEDTVKIAGGIILFLIALKMVFPTDKGFSDSDIHEREPFIVPLAVPLIAGPAVLAAVILYSHELPNDWIVLAAIVLAWIASTIILLSSSFFQKVLGKKGLTACERLMGLLLTLIAVQMFLSGLKSFMHPNG
jgi:multiple antibiotic resistance protein